jgi:hypothetical protein
LREGGYTNLVVYLAQQIHQFRLRGKDFAMQHLGTDEDLVKVMRDIWATLSPEERSVVFPLRDRLQGLSPEELLQGLPPEKLERLRELLQVQTKTDNPSSPE